MQIPFTPIGTIFTPFKALNELPRQPADVEGVKGTVSIRSKYLQGLTALVGFSHLYLLYHIQVSTDSDALSQGIFCAGGPERSNGIGLSLVKLNGMIGNLLQVENVDILNGTSLLDIKPYLPPFDPRNEEKSGWFEQARDLVKSIRSDQR